MAMRPLAKRQDQPSLVTKAIGLALAPAIYTLQLSSSLAAWGLKQATASMQLPLRIIVTALQLLDAFICDLLVMLTKQPGLRLQVGP